MKKRQDDYEAFVAKFERKRTSDDCYTPPEVYDIVRGWLGEQVDLAGAQIVRPFWPDTDYREVEYPDGCVVVDNPPFFDFRRDRTVVLRARRTLLPVRSA